MMPDADVAARPIPAQATVFVLWAPCAGLQPIVVNEPRAFLIGQAIIAAMALGALGLFCFLLPPD